MVRKNIAYFIKEYMPEMFYPVFLKYKYKKKTGKDLNLNNPTTYTEKIQAAKLLRRDPLLTELSDKIRVKDWVKDKIGEEYLVQLVAGPYNDPDEIDFSKLPDKYVIKTNHGCGTNIVVTDNAAISEKQIRKQLKKSLKYNFAYHSLELQYKNIKPQIYIEKFIIEDGMDDLPDYKFFCFDGKVYCLYVMINTYPDHHKSKLGIFDRDFNLLPYRRGDFEPITCQIDKPEKYDEMVKLAEILAEGFSHVRVDLYNIEGKIYFGEMTFTTGSGIFRHVPDEFDMILGKQWDLNSGL